MRRLTLGIALAMAGVPYANAQQAGAARSTEEVVVTARRLEESLQDVPASVSVLTSADIRETGVDNVEEIIKLREKLDTLQSNMEDRISDLQTQLQGRMAAIKGQLPASLDAEDFDDLVEESIDPTDDSDERDA